MSLHKSPWYLSLKGKTRQKIGMVRVEWIELLPNFMPRKTLRGQSVVPSVGRIKREQKSRVLKLVEKGLCYDDQTARLDLGLEILELAHSA